MGFEIVTKLKPALNAKTKALKKKHEHKVSLASLSATATPDLLRDMQLERVALKELTNLARRVRKSDAAQVERVQRNLTKHGQVAPILIDEKKRIINGHIVAQALRNLGSDEIWAVRLDHLDDHEAELLHVALNRTQECGEWDLEALGPLLIDLDEAGFDLEVTGFSLPELDILMLDGPGDDAADEAPEPDPPAVPVSQLGDLWVLGPHRVLCGDALKPESYDTVLEGKLADCVLTDCPWNIPIDGFVSGNGKVKHADFVQGAGEMSPEQFVAFCDSFHQRCAERLGEGGVFYSFIDFRSVDLIMAAGRGAGLRHVNTAVWVKGTGGMGVPWRSAHELIVIFCKGAKLAVSNVALGKHGRDRTNVWSYPGANRRGSSANKALQFHPTGKSIALVADAILDVTKRGALVLDCFLGSGTTVLAAQRTGRQARGIELDPKYVDVAIRRWEDLQAQPGARFDRQWGLREMSFGGGSSGQWAQYERGVVRNA